MAEIDPYVALTKAFSGLGVDENLFISLLGKWNQQERETYRVHTTGILVEDERQFQRWNDQHILQLRQEFLRLKDAVVVYTTHLNIIFSLRLLALDLLNSFWVQDKLIIPFLNPERKLLVALVSSHRYEGPRVNNDLARSEAMVLMNAIKNANKKNF